MAILKKGSYEVTKVSSFNLSSINLATEEKVEGMKFDRQEYLALVEEAKKEGYDEGKKEGFSEGYNEGMAKFENEKDTLYESLENDKSAASDFLLAKGLEYIDFVKIDVLSLISSSINKLFLDSVSNESIMNAYLSNLLTMLETKYKDFTISANAKTIDTIKTLVDEVTFGIELDNSLADYDVSIKSLNENAEYYLKDEFEKINNLFLGKGGI